MSVCGAEELVLVLEIVTEKVWGISHEERNRPAPEKRAST